MHSSNRLFFTVAAVGLLALLVAPFGADAAPLRRDRVEVFQLKSVTKKRRFELAPIVSVGLNDSFVQVMNVGGSFTYHISEGLSFDLRGFYAIPVLTDLIGQMREGGANALLRTNATGSSPDKFNPAISRPRFYGMGHFIWSPLIGKFAAGNSVVDFDIYLMMGGGVVLTDKPGGTSALLPGVSFGVGGRLLLTRWLTLRFEVQDVMYSQTLTGDGGEVGVLTHNVFFSVGFGFMFPLKPVYTFEAEPR